MKKILFHKWAVHTVRTLLGLNLFLSGFFILFGFVKLPPANPQADAFIDALIQSGYVFTLLKVVEIIVGILLITNILTPLSLVVIAPITLNILLFNTILWTDGAPAGVFVFVSNMYLLFAYLPYYQKLFALKSHLQNQ